MKTLDTADIRHKFIAFFQSRQHTFVPSASTLPVDDKTILFTVAGMAQFKSVFMGQEKRPYVRATNSQKCIRVADLDDVGKDGRHLTMFEMLGSWSFGDYYKKDAIGWAYEFIKDELKLDLSKLWVSVHHTDHESADIWQQAGVHKNRIVYLGDKDNFWAMGPTGPCGPCTEMYYDQGEQVGSCYQANITCKGPGCDCDRFLEFWNLVFMQFQRDASGQLHDLPLKSVDTGMGLERLACLLQGKTNVFEIDIFNSIRTNILEVAHLRNNALPVHFSQLTAEQIECTNVIADHARFLCFTIADGANFSNEGRGYVLRRVLRRAVRYIDKLCPDWDQSHVPASTEVNASNSFLLRIMDSVIHTMQSFFPELPKNQNRIHELIIREEAQFRRTLKSGLNKFNEFLNHAKVKNQHTLSGEQVFTLHDTFGFPADLTRILCAEHKFDIDMQGYESFMLAQKEKSRAEAKFYKFADDPSVWTIFNPAHQKDDSNFEGYFLKPTLHKDSNDFFQKDILYTDVKKIRQLQNRSFELVVKNTPFYPEGGGQVSDKGVIEILNGEDIVKFDVLDVKKTSSHISHILHHESWSDAPEKQFTEQDFKNLIHPGTQIVAYVNLSFRQEVARHHTATHLLHKALQMVLGDNIRQAGSLVKNDMLRFDFSYHAALSQNDIEKIENIVNAVILKNKVVYTHKSVPLAEAKQMGAMAMFDEKYEDTVRVLQIENFSLELCGGTHVQHTGEIGQFKILSEGSVTSGVRRIEAVAGMYALAFARNTEYILDTAADSLKCAKADLLSKISQIKDFIKTQEKEVFDLQSKIADLRLKDLLMLSHLAVTPQLDRGAQDVSSRELDVSSRGLTAGSTDTKLNIISAFVSDSSLKELEILCDKIKERPYHICILATVVEQKVHLIAGMHSGIIKEHKNIHLGKLMLAMCEKLNGKGGGRPDFARGSGTLIDGIHTELENIKKQLLRADS